MNKNHNLLFIGFFLAVIYSVPLVQAAVEFARDHRIQAFDIVVDAIITPLTKANAVHELLVKERLRTDGLIRELAVSSEKTWTSSTTEKMLDEALFTVGDIRKAASRINRHVNADTTVEFFRNISILSTGYSDALTQVRSGRSPDSISQDMTVLTKTIDDLLAQNPKRTALSIPVLATKNVPHIFWNDLYLRPYEKEMENASIFAGTIRPAVLGARYVLFGDLGEKAVAGTTSWFFYRPDVDYLVRPYIRDPRSIVVDPNGKPVNDDPIRTIVDFKSQLDSLGVDLLVVIVPVKASIYPDLLSRRMKPEQSGSFSHSLRIIRDLNAAGVSTVDLFSAFAKERADDTTAGDSIYLARDTHWRGRGVLAAARAVGDRIKRYPWYVAGTTEFEVDTIVVDRMGDISAMTTLPFMRIHDLALSFPAEKTKCYQVYQVTRDGSSGTAERHLYKDDFKRSSVLVIGDSFSRIYQTDEPRSAGWISHLARELSQPVASLINDGGASTLVRQSLARRINLLKGKKLVVWEVVERDFRFGEDGWKRVPLSIVATEHGEGNQKP
jgi:SGNH hydrolase-like domain, acetyltransferase AlgX